MKGRVVAGHMKKKRWVGMKRKDEEMYRKFMVMQTVRKINNG